MRRINFSKELINLILAQEECNGVTVFFCMPPTKAILDANTTDIPVTVSGIDLKREVSVLLMGIKDDGTPLTTIPLKSRDNEFTLEDDTNHGRSWRA